MFSFSIADIDPEKKMIGADLIETWSILKIFFVSGIILVTFFLLFMCAKRISENSYLEAFLYFVGSLILGISPELARIFL